MYGGIDQLVNTYKVNPNPLQERVQQAQQQAQQKMLQQGQQGQPSNEIPPDLEEAIALQEIAKLHQGAQNQQAMQAGGAQPSVVEKLRQMLGHMQQQGQPQIGQMPQQMPQGQPQQPVMAAHGGSIAHLVSNLGRHYNGGGIVAFKKAGAVEDPKAEDIEYSDEPLGMGNLPQRPNPLAALARLVSQAVSREKKPSMMLEPSEAPNITPTEVVKPEPTPATANAPVANTPAAPAANVPPAPRPTAVNPGIGGGPAKPVVEPTDPLEVAIRKSAMEALAKDPEEVRRRAIEANAKAMGLDALLKPSQERVAKREQMIEQIKAGRQPLWIDALMAAGKPTKGGVAGVLNQMASGVNVVKQGYDVDDLRFLDELNKLNSDIDKAKIEGRYKDVAAGETAVKDLIADKRQAEQSGTSLLTNKETARSRERIAEEGRLSRAQSASLAAQGREDARSDKTDAGYREQAMKLAMAAALKEMQLPANMVKYKNTTAEELAAAKFNSIYNALKSGKMGAAPSAESPSGTPADINALLKKYGG